MKLALGTVQFGLDYGISNETGKPDDFAIKDILDLAMDSGIDVLDTAHAYGNSESVLGKFRCGDNFKLVTKTIQFKSKKITKSDGLFLKHNFEKSLDSLNSESTYGLLVHLPTDLLAPGGEYLYEQLLELRDSGKVKKIGVSIYTPAEVEQVLKRFDIDLIQVPLNIFDQRLVEEGYLKELKSNEIEIHARSVFLQGLLLMDTNQLPNKFDSIRDIHKELSMESKDANIKVVELCLNYVLQQEEVDKVICGVNNLNELDELISYANNNKTIDCDYSKYSIKDLNIIDPATW